MDQTLLVTSDSVPQAEIELGGMVSACAVSAANVVKDIRENIRNLVGGKMAHYETLIEQTLERATHKLLERAEADGYDGVVSIKVANPVVVDGGVEILVYGTGFTYKQ